MSQDPLVFAFFFDGGWADLIWHASNLIITVALFIGFVRERRKRIELKAAADVLTVLAKLEGVTDARRQQDARPAPDRQVETTLEWVSGVDETRGRTDGVREDRK